MRAVFQRVSNARVEVDGEVVGSIGYGALVLLGVRKGDTDKDVEYIAGKIAHLRVFADDEGKMNRSLIDVSGEALVVSQFTLYGDARGARRPSFTEAAGGSEAEALYLRVCERVRELGVPTQTGAFGAMMKVGLVNEGPVTILLESSREF